MKIAIIGGVAGGASAATRARRIDESAEIVIYEKGPYVSYANCGLPYYIGGIIARSDDLLLETPESLWDRFRIRVETETEVTGVDLASGLLAVSHHGERRRQVFDRLILSPGSTPSIPNLPGIDRDDVFSLRTVPDAIRMHDYLDAGQVKHATVVGAGFIGLEMAEVLRSRGITVALIDQRAHVLPQVDPDIAQFMEEKMTSLEIQIMLNNTLSGITGAIGHPVVELSSGRSIHTDMVVIGLGVRPSLALAREMGLAIGPTGALAVNDHMQTSRANVWAAGDAVEKHDLITGEPRWWPLAGTANKEGRVAGTNAAGGDARLVGSLGTGIVRVHPYVIGVTGLTETRARKEGIAHQVVHTIRGHHASYYPGAHEVLIKLLFDPNSGRLLGAQAAGQEGVDKRIDVIATAIHAQMTVDDLADLDLAYAPSIGAAKDPVVITGMSAGNHRSELVEGVSSRELSDWMKAPERLFLLDVRDEKELEETGRLPGACHIPLNDIRLRVTEIPPESRVVVYCRTGHRSYLAARILRQLGRQKVYNLDGGLTVWNLCNPPSVVNL